ncbi:MAG: rhodanese-like domain-containing protein [Ilumatobacter sp.]|nr:rhodanese-like domain-containing protein [Ilumatobacter sp.]
MNRRTTVLGAVALSATMLLAACGGDDTDSSPVADDSTVEAGVEADAVPFGVVDPATAMSLIEADAVTVIDVRTPEEYAEGHVDGATLIDFSQPDFADRAAELDPDGTYLVYCRSGNRSAQAVAVMADLGIDQVYDLGGGVIAYDAAGLPLVQ